MTDIETSNDNIETTEESQAEERISVATQWQLMLWRFEKHKLAIAGVIVIICFYLVVLLGDFLAYMDSENSDAYRALMPPQKLHLFDEGKLNPFVYPMIGKRDLFTFQWIYDVDTSRKIYINFFAKGYKYRLLGFIPGDIHLMGISPDNPGDRFFIFGTDVQGRDIWSRLMMATRTSLTIGLVSVMISLLLGVAIGGISGFFGGSVDLVIQRIIEILRSIPTIPLWMGLAAALPPSWSVLKVYFAITIIISLIGWTELAQQVRGRTLSLRQEEFVLAARLAGCTKGRIIFKHIIPSLISHIIATMTLALPSMIISETSLSFLGLGLRPPAISWGVMLQQAQNIQSLVLSPWLLIPAIPVIIIIIAFNFFGDGLRDAADPYGS
jgi:peptide/nickel transport system permease protein